MDAEDKPEQPRRHGLWPYVLGFVFAWLAVTAMLRSEVDPLETAAAGDHLWEVLVTLRIAGAEPGDTVRLAVPVSRPGMRLVGQRMQHAGWRQRFRRAPTDHQARRLEFVALDSSPAALDIGFTLHQSSVPAPAGQATVLSDEQRQAYLASDAILGLGHETVQRAVQQLADRVDAREDLAQAAFKLVANLAPRRQGTLRPVPEVLAGRHATERERVNVLVALSRAAGLPARPVTGLVISGQLPARLADWVEIFDDEAGWRGYDPTRGVQGGLPARYLPVVRGEERLVQTEPERAVEIDLQIVQADELLSANAPDEREWTSLADLQRLPVEVRETLGILLALPVAVLVSTLFRELTGVHSFGTFTPALFALALMFTDWQTAALTLALVLGFGVAGRQLMPPELRRLPRLTIVMVLVAVGIALGVSVMDLLQWQHGGEVVLLPIVILTTLVDRIYSTMDTEGAHNALARLGWTLLQAVVLCLPILQIEVLREWLVRYPESHLLTLALVLLIATYPGPRLADMPGMRWLLWPSRTSGRKKAPARRKSQG